MKMKYGYWIFILLVCGIQLPVSAQNFTGTSSFSIPDRKVDNKSLFFQKDYPLNLSTVAISAVGFGYGMTALHPGITKDWDISIRNSIVENHPTFYTQAADYLKYAPAVAMIGLNMAGIHGKHNMAGQIAIYGAAALLDAGMITEIKILTNRTRPDQSNNRSFPSGHTGAAFVAAEVLRMEYRDQSPWIGIAGYAVATSVGMLRMYNNRHWFSDVVAGAAVGFLSTHLVYLIVPWFEKHVLQPWNIMQSSENKTVLVRW